MKISDQLRNMILQSRQSRYAIAQATGVEQATLSRFVNGKAGLSIANVDALADHFQLKLTRVKSPKKAKP